jgi:hypothetical protein
MADLAGMTPMIKEPFNINSPPDPSPEWIGVMRDKIHELEADLGDQGLKLFPNTRSGQHAYHLWRRIRHHLFRGGAVQITASVLKFHWHREEIRRARNVLIEMELIRRRTDGLYVLGRYDWLDEEVREQFSDLKIVEEVLVALSSIVTKSKTHMPRKG